MRDDDDDDDDDDDGARGASVVSSVSSVARVVGFDGREVVRGDASRRGGCAFSRRRGGGARLGTARHVVYACCLQGFPGP